MTRWVVVLLALCFGTGAAFAQTAPVLTLAQAVDEALVKNHRLIDQRDVTRQSELGVDLARGAFRPKVLPNISGSFGQTDISSQTYRVDLSQRLATGTEVRLSVGTSTAQIPGDGGDVLFYNADTTVTIGQPLLRGFGKGVAQRQLSSARWRRAEAERQQVMSEQQVAIEVAGAYYAIVSQRAFAAVAKQSVERSIQLRDASEAKMAAGLVSQLDVLRAQQLVTQSQIQLFDAESAIEDARDQLAFLLGRTPGEALDVVVDIPKLDYSPIDADSVLALALANRLDLRGRAEANLDAEQQVAYVRNQALPQVDMNLALTRRETAQSFGGSFGLDGYRFATFFTIGMPVDRTAQRVEMQNALIERAHRSREIKTMERQITDDVRRALRDRERILRSVVAAESEVDVGRQEVDVARERYERGLSNNLDVIQAESSLLNAESRRIQVAAEAAVSAMRLRAIAGVFDPRKDIGSTTGAVPPVAAAGASAGLVQ